MCVASGNKKKYQSWGSLSDNNIYRAINVQAYDYIYQTIEEVNHTGPFTPFFQNTRLHKIT